MRVHLLALPLALVAAPALAQQQPQAQSDVAENMRLPPQMSDPRLADRLTDALKIMSKAFLDLPVGQVEAALEGRQPSAADRRRTVRSEAGMTERELEQEIERSRPAMRAGQQALVRALPSIMRGLSEAKEELERAATNIPRPDYPRR